MVEENHVKNAETSVHVHDGNVDLGQPIEAHTEMEIGLGFVPVSRFSCLGR